MDKKYNKTVYACFLGYIVQAIVNNFIPLLFIMFHKTYQIPMSQITLLITFNFGVQLLVDLVSIKFVDKIGYRASMLIAHVAAALGLALLAVLPDLCGNPFIGLLISVTLYAIGGGLLEVLVSPIVEACPSENKEMMMSLLHSFYCWGHVMVVLVSTAFFYFIGMEHWKWLAVMWACVPALNFVLFTQVPIAPIVEEGEEGLSVKQLFANKVFWVLMIMMICAGASEQAVSQWASTFAEQGLHVSKAVGDLAGPMSFAILMGLARAFYGKYGEKISIDSFMVGSCILCIVSYLCIGLSSSPLVGLIGCGICGISVGIMWPGTFSKAAAGVKNGGTAMFALLALGGDLGCGGGPTVAGIVSSMCSDDLRKGILAALVFPILLGIGVILCKRMTSYERV